MMKTQTKPIPIPFEEVISDVLKIKPEPEKPKTKKAKRDKSNWG
jgi:hypothetical protein